MPDKTYKDKETGKTKTDKELRTAGATDADIADMLKLGYIEQVPDVKKKEEPSSVASSSGQSISNPPSASNAQTSTEIDPSKYETKLSPQEEPKFQAWLDNNYKSGRITKGDYDYYKKNGYGYDYDFRAAFKAGEDPSLNATDNKLHWSDIGKKPNHPSFSNESKYNGADGHMGGTWQGDTFVPYTPPAQQPSMTADEFYGKYPWTDFNKIVTQKFQPKPEQTPEFPAYDYAQDPNRNTAQVGESTQLGIMPNEEKVKQYEQLRATWQADRSRQDALEKKVKSEMLSADNRKTYFTVNRPALTDKPYPDSKFTYLNNKALDSLLDSINDVDGKPVTEEDKQSIRNKIISQVDQARDEYDVMEKAKRNYEGLKDKYGRPTDPITELTQARISADQERPQMQKAMDNQLSAKGTELQSMVEQGKISPDQAASEYNNYRISLQGNLDQYISGRVMDLAKQTLPDLYNEKINKLREEQKNYKPDDVKYAMLQNQILEAQGKQKEGLYYAPEDDPAWVAAVGKAYKQHIIDKNESMKSVFDNQAFNSTLPDNAPARDLRIFASKQLQGVLHGIGGVEQMTGGILNMYGAYTLGNHLTDNGKAYAAENFLPMPLDKDGNQVVIDDSPGTWIASNISAQAPNAAMLMAAAETGGAAFGPALEAMGASSRALPFLKGAIGGLIETVPESLMEAGDYYNQAISEGKSIRQAREGSSNVFKSNMVLLGFTNPLEFGMMKFPTQRVVGKLAKGFTEANVNGIQEIVQNQIQNAQDDPTTNIFQYALSPEGQSTGLSGAAMGILQNATVGAYQNWQVHRETAGMFDFNSQYRNQNNAGLPPNSSIAKTIFGAFQMKDTPDRGVELKKLVDKLKDAGTYTEDDADRVKGLIEDVEAVKGNVPKYGSPEQRMAVLNELLQIHTNNKYRETSGIEDIANLQDARNAESTQRIKNIMLGKEPLYFINGYETSKEQLLDATKDKKLMKMKPDIRVVNDPETLSQIMEAQKQKPADKWETGHPEDVATIPGEPVEFYDLQEEGNFDSARAVVVEHPKGYQALLANGSSLKTVDKNGKPVDYFEKRDDAMKAIEQYFVNPNPESVVKPTDEEHDKQFAPVADELVKIESQINNKGYDLSDDYDNQVSLTDKKTKELVADPNELPDDVHELVGKYEAALSKLGDNNVNVGNLLQEARKRFFGEEASFSEANPKGLPGASPTAEQSALEKEASTKKADIGYAEGLTLREKHLVKHLATSEEYSGAGTPYMKSLHEASKDPTKQKQVIQELVDQSSDMNNLKKTAGETVADLVEGLGKKSHQKAQEQLREEATKKAEENNQPGTFSKTVSEINKELPVDSDSPDVQQRSSQFEEDVRSEVQSLMQERGLNTSEEEVDKLHTNAMAEIFDEAGQRANADKSIAEVIDDVVPKKKTYKNPVSFAEGTFIESKHSGNLYQVIKPDGRGGVAQLKNLETGGIENWNAHGNPHFEKASDEQVNKLLTNKTSFVTKEGHPITIFNNDKSNPNRFNYDEVLGTGAKASGIRTTDEIRNLVKTGEWIPQPESSKQTKQNKAQEQPKKPAEKKPAKEITLGRAKNLYKYVGENAEGQSIYEDENGVRAVEKAPGIYANEMVSIVPTRAGVEARQQEREKEFMTKEEIAKPKAEEKKVEEPKAAEQAQLSEKEQLLKELADKKAKLKESLRQARGQLNMGIDPKVIADGIDLLATYTKLGVYEFKQIVKDLVDTFGKEFMDKENTDALKGVYAYYRQNLPREERKNYSTEDQVDDFIDGGMNVDNLENPNLVSQNGQGSTNTTLQQPLRNDEGRLAGTVQSEVSKENVPTGNAENLPAGNSNAGAPTGGAVETPGKRRGRSEKRNGGKATVPAADNGRIGNEGRPANVIKGENTDQGSAGSEKVEKPLPENPADRNHVIKPSDEIVPDGRVSKVTSNMDALLLLRTLESENRNATPEEKSALAKFVGWGGLSTYLSGLNNFEAEEIIGAMMNGTKYELGYGYSKQEIEPERINTLNKSFDEIAKIVQKKFNELLKQYPKIQSLTNYKESIPLDDVRKAIIPHLLLPNELEAAKVSTENAHYTERSVINSVWNVIKQFGFKGGTVLESSAGIGLFFGLMPQDLARRSNLIGVELDTVTNRLLKKLYPEADIFQKGFQDVRLGNNSVDLAVSNVPFGDAGRIFDEKNKDISGFSLHNYFIAKNLRLLKPGGIAIMITSKSTMDNAISRKARQWFTAPEGGNSELIGAIRLPNNAFDQNAGTQVTTDLMIFQKRKDNLVRNINPFLDTTTVHSEMYDDAEGKPQMADITINDYYLDHPDNMIGNMKFAYEVNSGGLYGKYDATLHADPGTNVVEKLNELLAQMPENIFQAPENAVGKEEQVVSYEKEGKMFSKGGSIYVSKGDTADKADFKFKTHEQAAHTYIPLRDQLHNLLFAEQDANSTDEQIEEERKQLNKQYDDFVKKHGSLAENGYLYDFDIDYSLAASMEDVKQIMTVDDKGKVKKSLQVSKGTILKERVNFPRTEPSKADNIDDAIQISIAYKNHVNDEYIGKLLNMKPEDARAQMLKEGKVFENPNNALLETPDDYLSGEVRKKLHQAEEAAKDQPQFQRNVEALKRVIPEDIPAHAISFKMGVSWLPQKMYFEFTKNFLGVKAQFNYLDKAGNWVVKATSNEYDSRNIDTYSAGTKSGIDIIDDIMNNRTTVIMVTIGSGADKKVVRDDAATARAADVQQEIKDAFSKYVKGNDEYKAILEKEYNERFNGVVEKKYNLPTFETYPGANKNIKLRLHQRKAVQRILGANTLLAHSVGTGKTFTIITAAMEMKRLGIAKKPMIAVQNATTAQFAYWFQKLYPGSRVLIPSEKEMEREGRRKLFGKIATGNWDAIILPHSQLDRLPDNPERVEQYIREKIEEIQQVLDQIDESESFFVARRLRKEIEGLEDDIKGLYGGDEAEGEEAAAEGEANTVRDLADAKLGNRKKSGGKTKAKQEGEKIVKMRARIEKIASRQTDDILYFEDLGVDAMFLDESHYYKKMGFQTGMQNIKGIDTKASKRALSLLMKTRTITEKTGGKNIVFATGTPITNTMAEAWTNLRYLAPDLLKEMGIEYFDQFTSTFAQVLPTLEQDAGGRFKVYERLAQFTNLPELITTFRTIADVVTTDDIPEFKEDPENAPPSLENGGITSVIVPISDSVKEIMKNITQAFDVWKASSGREKKERSWVPLVATGLAQKAAIDVRLVDPSQPDNPDSKVNYAVKNILKQYKEFDKYKATQFVFSDAIENTTGSAAASLLPVKGYGHFNLYQELKKKLMEGGIPENEIAIMTDAKYQNKQRKGELWEKVRQGTVRVVIGSTDKMGVGVDAAERMIALHHIDAPPRPDQFEQRNGRIVRQGNMFTKLNIPVKVYAYGTAGTRDATAFDRLKIKQKFINQVMKADFDKSVRETEDPFEEENLNADDFFAEMGASLSGSRTALQLVKNERDLRMERQRASNYVEAQSDNNYKKQQLEQRVKRDQNSLKRYQQADAVKKEHFDSDNTIKVIRIDDTEHAEKFGDAVDHKLTEVANQLLNSTKDIDKTSFPIYVNGLTTGIELFKNVNRGRNGEVNAASVNMAYSIPDLELNSVSVSSGSGQGFIQKLRNDLDAIDRRSAITKRDIADDEKRIDNLKKDLEKEYDYAKLRKLESEHESLRSQLIAESAAQEAMDKEAMEKAKRIKDEDLDSEIEQAKKDLHEELGDQLSSGLPLNALPQLTKLAYLYIRKGLRTASQFAKAVGTRINKVVVQAWNAAKKHFAEGGNVGHTMGASFGSIKQMFSPTNGNTGGAANQNQQQQSQGPPPTSNTSKLKTAMAELAKKREEARVNAEQMWKDLEKQLFGSITLTDDDFKNRPTPLARVTNLVNKLQDVSVGAATKKVSSAVKSMAQKTLESKNKTLIRIGKAVNSVFANLGKTQEDILRSEKFAGESRVRSVSDAVKISKLLRNMIDNNPNSLSRISQVLDPEFYQELSLDQFKEALKADMPEEKFDQLPSDKIDERYKQYREQFGFDDPNYKPLEYDDLSAEEKKTYDIIRSLYDAMHEINFSIGKLTPDTYEKNKGNYSARLYDHFEIPKEAEEAFHNNMVKLDESLYKERGDITEWKLLHRLADPVYAVSKRLYQTMANKSIIDYADFVNKTKKDAVSTKEKPGYRKLGWGYGSLSNKYVRDDIAEDFIGYFYADAMMQKFYDFVKGYDRFPVRQFYKKLYTVYNPGVHVGNITGNNVFGAMIGINPIRLNSNLGWAKKQADDYSGEYRYMLSNGLLNTDFTAQDLSGSITNIEKELENAIDKGGTLTDIKNRVEKFYSATDDVYKMAAFKSLLDLGYKPKEALDRVKEGFQNYRRVGKAYDLFSKVPLVGQPFGKFAGDLMRIVKNTVTTHPLNGAAFLFALKMMSNMFSYLSGENDEEKKIREARMGAAKIPLPDWAGGDVPLAWKIGGSEWNVARFLSPLFLYGSANNDDTFEFFQKLSPQPVEIPEWTNNPSGAGAVFMAKNANDPVVAPFVQLMFNSDFRGAPIFDPKENKYKASTLTTQEKGINALRFLSRSYVPYYSQGEDFTNAILGNEDYYGRGRAWWQVISNFIAGPKIVEFPQTRYGEILEQKMDGYGYRYAQEQRVIKDLTNQAAAGKITQEQYEKRASPHLEEMASIVEEANAEYKKLTGKVGSVNLKDREVLKGAEKREGQVVPEIQIPKVDIDIPKIEQ